jgi:hypothetical protein
MSSTLSMRPRNTLKRTARTKFAELGDFGVGMVVRNLRDADPTGAEPRQDVHQIGLVVGLERARHHRTGDDAQRLDLSEIIFERKVRRRVALVRHDREAVIDDVAMAVEQPPRRLRRGTVESRGGNDSGCA